MKEQQAQADRDREQAALDRENAILEQEALRRLNDQFYAQITPLQNNQSSMQLEREPEAVDLPTSEFSTN